jgi:nucleoporin NUP82
VSIRILNSCLLQSRDGLPALVVYETIDLGLVQAASLAKIDLAEVNHPVLMVDPVHDEALYIYHTFGAHSLDLSEMMLDLSKALAQENASETTPLPRSRGTVVCSLSEPVSPQSK